MSESDRCLHWFSFCRSYLATHLGLSSWTWPSVGMDPVSIQFISVALVSYQHTAGTQVSVEWMKEWMDELVNCFWRLFPKDLASNLLTSSFSCFLSSRDVVSLFLTKARWVSGQGERGLPKGHRSCPSLRWTTGSNKPVGRLNTPLSGYSPPYTHVSETWQ